MTHLLVMVIWNSWNDFICKDIQSKLLKRWHHLSILRIWKWIFY